MLTNLIDLVSRKQDPCSIAFTACGPISSDTDDARPERQRKEPSATQSAEQPSQGVGLGVALQALLRERRQKPVPETAIEVTGDAEDAASARSSIRSSVRSSIRPAWTIRKSGCVDLPAHVVRVLDHHRKKGLARHEAYLNEGFLGGDKRSSRRGSKCSSGRSSLRSSRHQLVPCSQAEEMSRQQPQAKTRASQRGRLQIHRVTAGRIVADSIIVGSPKGAAVATGNRVQATGDMEGASRLAVQEAGSSGYAFFNPAYMQTCSHEAAPASGDESDDRPSSARNKDSGRSSPSSLRLSLSPRSPSPKESSRTSKTFPRDTEVPGKRSSAKNTLKTLKTVVGAKVRAQVRRMTLISGQSDGPLVPEAMLDVQSPSAAASQEETVKSPGESAKSPFGFSAISEDEDLQEAVDKEPPNTDLKIIGLPKREVEAARQRKDRANSVVSEQPTSPEDSAMKAREIQKSPSARSLFRSHTTPVSPMKGDISPNSTGVASINTPNIKSEELNSETTPEKTPVALSPGHLFERGGVKLTFNPAEVKTKVWPGSRKRPKPPPIPTSPATVASSVGTGERIAPDKKVPVVEAQKSRRLSEAELELVPLKLIGFSSQRDNGRHAALNLVTGDPGTLWESVGPPEQSLVFDCGSEKLVCGLVLRCLGTKADPKDVCLLRSDNVDGPWIIVRRVFVAAGPHHRDKRKHEFIFQPGGADRYWRLVIHQNWGASQHVNIFAPLQMMALPAIDEVRDFELDLLPEALQFTKIEEAGGRRSLTLLFSEALNLTKEDREVRNIARKHGIPLDYADRVRDEFRKFNPGNELCYSDFAALVTAMVSGGPQRSEFADIPETRLRHLWHEVDVQGDGQVDFEDFLVWFHAMFNYDTATALSQHSSRQAATVTERYYASMGRDRLRQAVQRQEAAKRRQNEEGTW